MRKQALDAPKDMIVRLRSVVFLQEDDVEEQARAAWYVESSFVVLDETSEQEFLTAPVIHSLN
jgi:hypothetical protein